jgi:NDP-4-keto-2,6-dideoxyhexose 3-C-methyltransferase
MKCIFCQKEHNNLVVDLGRQYQSAFINDPSEAKNYKRDTLGLIQCPDCGFVQINEILPPDSMYREYWYRSGLNKSMVESLKEVVDYIRSFNDQWFGDNNHSLDVLDIGANDGTLLSLYPNHFYKVGFDPANNLAEHASKYCDVFINNYFDDTVHFKDKFDIVTSIAMFYDVDKPDEFVQNIKKRLAEDGLWCLQMTDLTCTLTENAFDNIVAEHLAYWTLEHLDLLMKRNGMKILDVSYNKVNGSSIRVLATHENSPFHMVRESVQLALEKEKEIYSSGNYWFDFNNMIEDTCNQVNRLVNSINERGGAVWALGASTKGNTLLQTFGLNNQLIPQALEVSKDKFDKYMLGSNIKIVSEKVLNQDLDFDKIFLLVLPWHFIDFFIEKKADFLAKGGKLIVPLPQPAIISQDGWTYL